MTSTTVSRNTRNSLNILPVISGGQVFKLNNNKIIILRCTQQIKDDSPFFVKPAQPFGRSVHDVCPDNVIDECHQQLLVVKQPHKAEIRTVLPKTERFNEKNDKNFAV